MQQMLRRMNPMNMNPYAMMYPPQYMNNSPVNTGFGNFPYDTRRKRTSPVEMNNTPKIRHSTEKLNQISQPEKKQKKSSSYSTSSGEGNSKKGGYMFNSSQVNDDKIEEFQNYISSRKTNILEYLCTQRGAKEIEKYLKKSPNECITILVNILNVNLTKIMTDIYGNYFCQKIIKTSTPAQVLQMLNYIQKDFIMIAKDYSGTHVLQALLDAISLPEHEKIILNSIKGSEMDMAYDNNATHVLQKIIQCIPEERRTELNLIILADIKNLSLDSNGICLVKKFIASNKSPENKKLIAKIITENCLEIAQNPFGNYAIQYILDTWEEKDCIDVINIIIENICSLSKQKFSSNVVEKIIELINDEKRKKIFDEFFNETKILGLLKNKYGKYVLQKSVKCMNEEQKQNFIQLLEKISANFGNKEKKMVSSFVDYMH